MKKILLQAIAFVLCLTLLAGCGGSASKPAEPDNAGPPSGDAAPEPGNDGAEELPDTDKLVLYSNATEDFLNLIVPTFEAKYNVKIEVIAASAGELINRLVAEADDPICDVAMIGGRTQFAELMHLFDPYVSVNDEFMAPHARNIDGYFNGLSVSLHPILVNRDVIDPSIKIEGYADLLQPELKGQIVMGNAAKSNSAFFHLLQILTGYAKNEGVDAFESDAGWDYMSQLLEQAIMLESSGSIHKAVADGEYGVALSWEDPYINYMRDGATNLEAVYPKECLYYGGGHGAVIKDCKNKKNAQLFIDHVQSREVQESFQTTSSRPARMDVTLPDYFITYEELEQKLGDRLVPYPDEWMRENTAQLQEHFNDLMTDILG